MKQSYKHPYLLCGLLACTLLFLVSLFLPMFTLTKLLVFNNTFSVYSGVTGLANSRQYVLFILLFIFTIALPLVKIFGLFAKLFYCDSVSDFRLVKASLWLGKWSMLDVFAVAILLMSVKLGALANIEIHLGFYSFTLSVLGMTALTYTINKKTRHYKTNVTKEINDE